MKKKAILVVLLCVMGLAALSIGNTEAAGPPWYTCTISKVGTNWAIYSVWLSDTTTPTPLFKDVEFVLDPWDGKQKELYLAALTAWANSSYVTVYLGGITVGSVVYALYATK